MNHTSERWLRWGIAVAVAANVAVFGSRLVSTVSRGALIETTGTERVPIYGIWKVANGHPVYENPFAGSYSLSLYNFGFYNAYGWIARLFGWQAGGLVLGTRLMTLLCTVLVTILFAWVLRSMTEDGSDARAPSWTWALLGGALTTLSSAAVSWFYLTVRPDFASLVFALMGLALYIRARNQPPTWPFAMALCFFLAWAFKQSTIGIFGGVCLDALVARRWRHVFGLGLPVAALGALCLWLGGPDYRLNVLTVPAMARFHPFKPENLTFFTVFVPCVHLWAAPLALVMMRRKTTQTRGAPHSASPEMRALAIVTAVSFAWCLLALTRDGGYRNTLLEAYVALSALVLTAVWRQSATLATRPLESAIVAAAFAGSAVFPMAQFATGKLGDVVVASRERADAAERLARRLEQAASPVLAQESLLAEPWHSTKDRYPAVVLDDYFYWAARTEGRLRDSGGVEGLIANHHFGALLLTGPLNLEPVARTAGYQNVSLGSDAEILHVQYFELPGEASRAPQ
jgi:MFS family permease